MNKTYEDCSDIIDQELAKRRKTWHLHAIAWMDFDDACQHIRSHISVKWSQWKQDKPLEPWVNTIISNQIRNIWRDKYKNFARPCLGCNFNQGSAGIDTPGLCGHTPSGTQCSECPLYQNWTKKKKSAHDIKLPVSMEYHSQEVYSQQGEVADLDIKVLARFHEAMLLKLKNKNHKKVYKLLIIEGKDEGDVAREMGYYTSESSRSSGYRQIKLLQKKFKEMAKNVLKTQDIIIYPL